MLPNQMFCKCGYKMKGIMDSTKQKRETKHFQTDTIVLESATSGERRVVRAGGKRGGGGGISDVELTRKERVLSKLEADLNRRQATLDKREKDLQQMDLEIAAKDKELEAERGAYVAQVAAFAPAGEAGLKQGDVILKIAGRDVAEARDVHLAVLRTPPGTKLPMTVRRGDKELAIEAAPLLLRPRFRIF